MLKHSRQIVEELTGMSLGHAGSVMQKSIAVQVKDSTSKGDQISELH